MTKMNPTSSKDYYLILGVERTASNEDIQRAYRKLARQFHPDVNQGDAGAEERFKEVNQAYDVLRDGKTRRDYDEFGDNWRHADQLRKRGSFTFHGSSGVDAGKHPFFRFSNENPRQPFSFGDIFSDQRAHPQQIDTDITLEEAYFGCKRLLNLEAGNNGSRSLEIEIPRGIADGGKVRISPQGARPVEVKVKVLPHHRFRREGDDLHVETPTSMLDALLGSETTVKTMDGRVVLKIPQESQNGRSFRLAGKGMPKLRSDQRGDLYVTLQVVLPERLNDEQRTLLQRLSEIERGKREAN